MSVLVPFPGKSVAGYPEVPVQVYPLWGHLAQLVQDVGLEKEGNRLTTANREGGRGGPAPSDGNNINASSRYIRIHRPISYSWVL